MKKYILVVFAFVFSAKAQILHTFTNTSTVVLTTTSNNLVLNGVEHYNVPFKSNQFTTFKATNGLFSGDFRFLNSNGVPIMCWNSNGVYVLKPISP